MHHVRHFPAAFYKLFVYEHELSRVGCSWSELLDALQRHPACTGRLGVVGVCLGGHLAFRAAFNEEVRAVCCMYPTDIHSGTLGEGQKIEGLFGSV